MTTYFITGQTGVGKSKIAEILCSKLRKPHVVCMDSIQMYKGLPILSNRHRYSPKLKQSLFSKFKNQNPITVHQFVEKVHAILENRVPDENIIFEGGSTHYINQIFSMRGQFEDQEMFQEIKEGAKELVNEDIDLAYRSLQHVGEEVKMPRYKIDKVDQNDAVRIQLHLANVMMLKSEGRTYADHFEQEQEFEIGEDVRKVFIFHSDKLKLNRQIDQRVEEMLSMDPYGSLFQEVIFEANNLQHLSMEEKLSNPFVKAIGFTDTLRFLRYIQEYQGQDEIMLNLFKLYMNQFKGRSRKYSTYQKKCFKDWPCIDVKGRSLEEVADLVLKKDYTDVQTQSPDLRKYQPETNMKPKVALNILRTIPQDYQVHADFIQILDQNLPFETQYKDAIRKNNLRQK